MRDKGEFGSFLFSYSFSFHFLWPEKFFQPSHADLIYWSCPNDLKKKNPLRVFGKQFVLFSV